MESVSTLSELIDVLEDIQSKHGGSTPLLEHKSASEGEYGMVEWHSKGRLTVEYDDLEGAVKIE